MRAIVRVALRAPDDEQRDPRRREPVGPERRERAEEGLEPLDGCEAADEEEHVLGVETEAGPRGRLGPRRNSSTSTPHGMTLTRPGSAPTCQTRSARSTRLEATIRSAPAAMRISAASRSAGSVSPEPRATAFLIAPSVWNMWTSGTSQRRARSSPARPDSQ